MSKLPPAYMERLKKVAAEKMAHPRGGFWDGEFLAQVFVFLLESDDAIEVLAREFYIGLLHAKDAPLWGELEASERQKYVALVKAMVKEVLA